jgi:3-oxoacyl-[acyl-carrier protein] reductase
MDKPVAVVSGGAQGIGFATVRLLAQKGFQVPALDIRPEVERAARSLRDEGLSVEGRIVDVTDRSAIAGALKDYSKINTVVCVAGIIVYKPFEEWRKRISGASSTSTSWASFCWRRKV